MATLSSVLKDRGAKGYKLHVQMAKRDARKMDEDPVPHLAKVIWDCLLRPAGYFFEVHT